MVTWNLQDYNTSLVLALKTFFGNSRERDQKHLRTYPSPPPVGSVSEFPILLGHAIVTTDVYR